MKLSISSIKLNSLLLLMLFTALRLSAQFAPIQVDNTLSISTCQLGNGQPVTLKIPREALTGDNIPLNITLPGNFSANCVTKVTIAASPELQFQTSSAYPFHSVGNNTYETVNPFPSNDGPDFLVYFKFPGYVTCNGAVGTLDVTVEVDCDGQKIVCQSQVQVVARAGNYWTVEKQFISGNLTCGTSLWRIYLWHNNPNPSGLGAYGIQGTLTENVGLPIISGGVHAVNYMTAATVPHSGGKVKEVILQNCVSEGSTITNVVDYDFVLGNNCGRMQGSVSEVSTPMVSPNASLSFTKQLAGATTNLSPGCESQYSISISNNGNVPWTNIVVTDVLPPYINPINVPTYIANGAWTWTLNGNVYTFTYGNNVLLPGQSATLYIPFAIDVQATPGATILNTATISYSAAATGTGGDTGSGDAYIACPGVVCPQIDTAIQNDTARTTFVVEEPFALPLLRKCILDPPDDTQPPLYQLGDVVRFQLKIGNAGAGPLSTVIHDALGAPNQNLQIIPSSIQYAYYTNVSTSETNTNTACHYPGIAEPAVPVGMVTANTADLQNPTFTITNMPGECALYHMNMLTIVFDALILPQVYGTKTNRAVLSRDSLPDLQSAVSYAVDQNGYLAVRKRADQDYVENGQTFHYIIELVNQGSVALNHLTLTDALPECVELAGNLEVRDALGNAIVGSTLSGNIQLVLPPTVEVAPGTAITVIVPVRKVSGSNCCNIKADATGRMVTTEQLLVGNIGSELEPAACVRSVECCDVPGFEAQLVQRDGHFYLQLTGGAVPLQEVDVTMLDFHVEYSSPDCKPANMGIFGQLSTTTTTLGGLVLGNGPMPAGNLSWGLGTASIVNGVLELEITEPGVLDIPCCDFELTFCLKVRVKDVNCNVCEKTICYTAEPTDPPCDLANLEINSPGRICPGQTISFTWSGGSPSGDVDIYLVNSANPTVYHVIATGVSNGTNSYTYTLPANFPCEGNQVWHIVIKDPKSDCQIISKRFTVTCCEPRCDCGEWLSRDVKITQVIAADNGNVQFESSRSILQKAANINVGLITRCGEKVRVNKGSYVLTAPNFGCTPESCTATYRWEIQRVGDSQTTVGTGKNFPYQFAQNGTYNIKIIPICGGKECEPCQIQVHVGRVIGTVNPDVVIDWNMGDLLP